MNKNISSSRDINISQGQEDPHESFLGKKLIVSPFQGRPFVARLVAITPDSFVFVGANGMKSIYARSAIASMFDKEAV